jgi:hypothetical protein
MSRFQSRSFFVFFAPFRVPFGRIRVLFRELNGIEQEADEKPSNEGTRSAFVK